MSLTSINAYSNDTCPYDPDSIEYDVHCTNMFEDDDKVEHLIVTGTPPTNNSAGNDFTGITIQPSNPVGGGYSQPSNENNEQEKEKAEEECLDRAKLDYDVCKETAHKTHLARYQICESVSWSGWLLSFISNGRLGSVPDTCGSKLEISTNLALAQCETDHTVNQQLCK